MTPTERIAALRADCLAFKRQPGPPDWRAVVDARSLRDSAGEKSWFLRMGLRTRDRLRAARFLEDGLSLLGGRLAPVSQPFTPDEIEAARQELSQYRWPGGQTGHCALHLDEVFRVGIDGLRQRLEVSVRQAGGARKMTGRSFLFALDGLQSMIAEVAATARGALGDATAQRRGELEAIADSCEHLASQPPRTFRDALQLLWLLNLSVSWADNAGLVSPGRIDRILIDYYRRDVAAGILTRAEALALIESLYLHINFQIPDGLAVAVMVGGTNAQGQDATNELSYLGLEALRRTHLVYPTVGVCWNKGTPADLSALAVELISLGYSTPAFFNDAVIRRGLEHYGLPSERSCDYINSTCVEITPVGCSNVWVASPYFSLCGLLLEEIAAQAAKKRPVSDFEAFFRAYRRRLAARVRTAAKEQNKLRLGRKQYGGKPLQSIFTLDCIESLRDIDAGGACVNWVECSFVGLANLADSLTVLRREVFETKALSFGELKAVLDGNFAQAEELRQRFSACPAYGNTDPEVDALVGRLGLVFQEECACHRMRPDNSHFIPGTFCWIMHQRLGAECGATPDGRLAGRPFADGGGPAQGREKNGPTSAILSTTSWDHSRLIGGLACNMKFPAALFRSPEDRAKLQALLLTYLQRGGFEVQVNVVDHQTLQAAERDPEAYRDLVVRIGGYTDYFVRLSPEMRGEVMRRTEFAAI
jgi:formate C-acetyltransferase